MRSSHRIGGRVLRLIASAVLAGSWLIGVPPRDATAASVTWAGTFEYHRPGDGCDVAVVPDENGGLQLTLAPDGNVTGTLTGAGYLTRTVTCPDGSKFYRTATSTVGGTLTGSFDRAAGTILLSASVRSEIEGTDDVCQNPDGTDIACPSRMPASITGTFVLSGTIELSPGANASGTMRDGGGATGTWKAAGGESPTEDTCDAPAVGAAAAAASGASRCIDVAVDHVELVQVIQDSRNTVAPLVAGKTSAARVFLKVKAPAAIDGVRVTVELSALRDGNLLRPALDKVNTTLTVRPAPERGAGDESVAFKLPLAWVGPGLLGLQATATVRDPWRETAPDDNDFVDTFEFTTHPDMVAAYVAVCTGRDPATNAATTCPTMGTYGASLEPVYSVFPIRDGGISLTELPGPAWVFERGVNGVSDMGPLVTWLTSQWSLARTLSGAGGRGLMQLVGMVRASEVAKTGYGGASDAGYSKDPNSGHTAFLPDIGGGGGFAHEWGHNLGLNHQQSDDTTCSTAPKPWDPGPTEIGEPAFDPINFKVVGSFVKDLMSYCPRNPPWITQAHYRTLIKSGLQTPFSANATTGGSANAAIPSKPVTAVAAAGSRVLIVSGTLSRDGSSGTLDPAFTVVAAAATHVLTAGDGPVCLTASGATGVLAESCFEVSFEPLEGSGEVTTAAFSVILAAPAGITSLRLTHHGSAMAALDAGATAPTLTASAPTAAPWTAPQELTWSVGSSGAGPARVAILYSPDGGTTWLPFQPDAAGASLTVDPTRLVAGSGNLFRILASDGLGTAAADIGPITVPAGVGRASIPGAGLTAPQQPVASPPPGGVTLPPSTIAVIALLLVAGVGSVLIVVLVRSPRRP